MLSSSEVGQRVQKQLSNWHIQQIHSNISIHVEAGFLVNTPVVCQDWLAPFIGIHPIQTNRVNRQWRIRGG